MTILVTGAAGFVGARVAEMLLDRGETVIGVDNLNDYYPIVLKQHRLARLQQHRRFSFMALDLASTTDVLPALIAQQPHAIIHLAAQAGVRASADRPFAAIRANLVGHATVLEMARALPDLQHLVYASSSSVYGDRSDGPFRETDRVDHPTSLYAATKRSDELISQVYAGAYGTPMTGLRFFTVYGPMGRPDMAYWTFADAILDGRPLTLFGEGLLRRDFTYIDDIASGVMAVLDRPPPVGIHQVCNIGNNQPETVLALVRALEAALDRPALIEHAPTPSYDVGITFADIGLMAEKFDWCPTTDLTTGIAAFARWFTGWKASGQPTAIAPHRP